MIEPRKNSVKFNGQERKYWIGPKDVGRPSPKYWIMYHQSNIWISEEVPEEFRSYMVLHELSEFEKFKDSPNSCLSALISELNFSAKENPEKHAEYLKFRKEVFKSLINFTQENSPNSEHLGEMRKSLSLLEDLSHD